MLLQGVFQLEGHATVFASKVSDVGVDLQVDMVGRDLVECFATFFTAPTVSSDPMGSQVDVHTMPSFELFPTLIATVRAI